MNAVKHISVERFLDGPACSFWEDEEKAREWARRRGGKYLRLEIDPKTLEVVSAETKEP